MGLLAVAGVMGLLGGAAAGGVALVRRRRQPPAHAVAQVAQEPLPAQEDAAAGAGLLGAGVDIGKKLAAGGVLGTIGAGVAASDLAARAVEKLGAGEGMGNAVRVGGPSVAVPVLLNLGVKKGLEALGAGEEVQKAGGQLAVAGAAGLLVPVAGVKAADALLGAVSPGAQEVVHDVFRPFDVTNPDALAGKVVGAVGGAVKDGIGGAVKAIGGLLGGGAPEYDGPPLANLLLPEEIQGRPSAAVAERLNARRDAISALPIGSLLSAGEVVGKSPTALLALAAQRRKAVGEGPPLAELVTWAEVQGKSDAEVIALRMERMKGPAPAGERLTAGNLNDTNWDRGVLVSNHEGLTPASIIVDPEVADRFTPGAVLHWENGEQRTVIDRDEKHRTVIELEGGRLTPALHGYPNAFTVRSGATRGPATVPLGTAAPVAVGVPPPPPAKPKWPGPGKPPAALAHLFS